MEALENVQDRRPRGPRLGAEQGPRPEGSTSIQIRRLGGGWIEPQSPSARVQGGGFGGGDASELGSSRGTGYSEWNALSQDGCGAPAVLGTCQRSHAARKSDLSKRDGWSGRLGDVRW